MECSPNEASNTSVFELMKLRHFRNTICCQIYYSIETLTISYITRTHTVLFGTKHISSPASVLVVGKAKRRNIIDTLNRIKGSKCHSSILDRWLIQFHTLQAHTYKHFTFWFVYSKSCHLARRYFGIAYGLCKSCIYLKAFIDFFCIELKLFLFVPHTGAHSKNLKNRSIANCCFSVSIGFIYFLYREHSNLRKLSANKIQKQPYISFLYCNKSLFFLGKKSIALEFKIGKMSSFLHLENIKVISIYSNDVIT